MPTSSLESTQKFMQAREEVQFKGKRSVYVHRVYLFTLHVSQLLDVFTLGPNDG